MSVSAKKLILNDFFEVFSYYVDSYGYMSKSTNHQHIIDRAAQNQHLWKFSGELSHRSDSFLDSINDFKRLMRQIAKYRSDDEAVVEYVVHLIRPTDGTTTLKFVASLPLSKKTGDERFIHEAELDVVVHSLWHGDVVRFAAYQPDALVSIADRLGYPAEAALATKLIVSRGIITGQAAGGAEIDTADTLCGK